jgi:hypothetical protein
MQKAGTRSLFNDGQPTWDQLWSLPAITANDKVGGIYALLYWIRIDARTREYHIYIGKSVSVSQRYAAHHVIIVGSSELKGGSNHYEVARLAAKNGGFRAVKVS